MVSNFLIAHGPIFVLFYAEVPGAAVAAKVKVLFWRKRGCLVAFPVGKLTYVARNYRFALDGLTALRAEHSG